MLNAASYRRTIIEAVIAHLLPVAADAAFDAVRRALRVRAPQLADELMRRLAAGLNQDCSPWRATIAAIRRTAR